MLARMAYTVLRLDELEWSKPSAGDQSRGIVRLSDRMRHMRANIWRLPPGTSGRRHAERVQEEIFVVLEGTATMALGDPPQRVELTAGSAVIVEPGTALQQRNESARDAVVLAIGAPREEPGNADYLAGRLAALHAEGADVHLLDDRLEHLAPDARREELGQDRRSRTERAASHVRAGSSRPADTRRNASVEGADLRPSVPS